MKIAVVGGTGLTGRYTVEALRRGGHEAVVIARSLGVDVATGAGLDAALRGVDAVIDTMNVHLADPEATAREFAAATVNLMAAEHRAGVKHHVLLSIVSIDRVRGNGHVQAKRAQEALLATSKVKVTIQRATQYHEFAAMVVSWTRQGDVAYLPPLLVQPVAAADVGEVLAEVAAGAPLGRAADLAGPEPQDLVDMARRTLEARGESVRLIPTWRHGAFGLDAAGEALLPGPEARIAPTTFDTWLAAERRRTRARA